MIDMIDYRKRNSREPKEYIVTYSYNENPTYVGDDGVRIDEFLIDFRDNCCDEWAARDKAKEELEDIARRENKRSGVGLNRGNRCCWGFRIVSIEEKK